MSVLVHSYYRTLLYRSLLQDCELDVTRSLTRSDCLRPSGTSHACMCLRADCTCRVLPITLPLPAGDSPPTALLTSSWRKINKRLRSPAASHFKGVLSTQDQSLWSTYNGICTTSSRKRRCSQHTDHGYDLRLPFSQRDLSRRTCLECKTVAAPVPMMRRMSGSTSLMSQKATKTVQVPCLIC